MQGREKYYIGILMVALVVIGFLLFKDRVQAPESPTDENVVNEEAAGSPGSENKEAPASPTTPPSSPSQPPSTLRTRDVTLLFYGQASVGQTGSAKITEVSSTKTRVVVTLNNYATNVSQPVRLHAGRCKALEEIDYSLNAAINGRSDTTLSLPFNKVVTGDTTRPKAIVVYKSFKELSTITSCGDIL